jgi:hypothetical protein
MPEVVQVSVRLVTQDRQSRFLLLTFVRHGWLENPTYALKKTDAPQCRQRNA